MKFHSKTGATNPLLVSRREAAQILGGVDVSTIRRLERSGLLKPKRLTRRPRGQVFFLAKNVFALVEESPDDH